MGVAVKKRVVEAVKMHETIKDEIRVEKISDLSFWLNRMRSNVWHTAVMRLKEGAKEVTIKVEVT